MSHTREYQHHQMQGCLLNKFKQFMVLTCIVKKTSLAKLIFMYTIFYTFRVCLNTCSSLKFELILIQKALYKWYLNFCLEFLTMYKNSLITKIRLTSKLIMSQTSKQTLQNILLNISRSRGNQTLLLPHIKLF